MLRMTHDIKINGKRLNRLVSCEIEKSAEQLSDTATLQVNAMTHNRSLQVEDQIKATMSISIALGYDDKNETEFSGYITSTSIKNGTLTIRCEDAIYLLRKDVANQQLTNATVVEIAEQVVSEIAPSLEVRRRRGALGHQI